MDNLDIYRAASTAIRFHSDDAELYIAGRADALLAKGDTEGSVSLRRV